MNRLFWLLYVIGIIILISCAGKGTTTEKLSGDEANLPEELKGLKVYKVSTGNGKYVNVAILNSTVNSFTYPVGKHTESTIMVKSKDDNSNFIKYSSGFDIYLNFIDGSVRTIPNNLNVIREFDIIQEGDTCKFREFDIKTKSML
jgi:hypothetical protein